jgi:hypothetical protein
MAVIYTCAVLDNIGIQHNDLDFGEQVLDEIEEIPIIDNNMLGLVFRRQFNTFNYSISLFHAAAFAAQLSLSFLKCADSSLHLSRRFDEYFDWSGFFRQTNFLVVACSGSIIVMNIFCCTVCFCSTLICWLTVVVGGNHFLSTIFPFHRNCVCFFTFYCLSYISYERNQQNFLF